MRIATQLDCAGTLRETCAVEDGDPTVFLSGGDNDESFLPVDDPEGESRALHPYGDKKPGNGKDTRQDEFYGVVIAKQVVSNGGIIR